MPAVGKQLDPEMARKVYALTRQPRHVTTPEELDGDAAPHAGELAVARNAHPAPREKPAAVPAARVLAWGQSQLALLELEAALRKFDEVGNQIASLSNVERASLRRAIKEAQQAFLSTNAKSALATDVNLRYARMRKRVKVALEILSQRATRSTVRTIAPTHLKAQLDAERARRLARNEPKGHGPLSDNYYRNPVDSK